MSTRVLMLQLKTVPPVAKRGQHVLILLRDLNRNYILGAKDAYPKGIYRLVGGGMEKGELPLTAARRELHEELHISAPAEDFHKLGKVTAHIRDAQDNEFTFTTHIFFLDIGDARILPSDDLDGVVRFDPSECAGLIERFTNLSKKFDAIHKFSWYDYGQIYAPIHEFAFAQAKKLTSG